MKISELYSLSTGLKFKQPFIIEDFFPVDFDIENAILVNTSLAENTPSKTYDYWQIVVDFIRESLGSMPKSSNHSFNIVQISATPVNKIAGCSNHLIGVTPNQAAYLISKCRLLITGDHLYAHLAAKYKKDCVTLYGSTSHKVNCLNPHSINLTGVSPHPTYQANEAKKNINTITPEFISKTALRKLKIKNSKINFETVFTGATFLQGIIEVIPDSIVNPKLFPDNVFNLRMDYLHDIDAMEQILIHRKYNIIANKEIPIEIIKKYLSKINVLNFEIDNNSSIDYCKKLKHCGAKIIFFTRLSGEELNNLRFSMLDVSIVECILETKKPIDIEDKECNNLKFKTNKFLLSNGKIYLSHEHWINQVSTPSFIENTGEVINSDNFWKDQGYYYIFK